MMNINANIVRRVSVRDYSGELLSQDIIDSIKKHIGALKPIDDGIRVKISLLPREEFVARFSERLAHEAPYYFVLSSEDKPGFQINAGFIMEQLVIYLTALDLGTCYLGSVKPQKDSDSLKHVICLAFGRPKNPMFRISAEQFKRKASESLYSGEITEISMMRLIEAARLAPSAINLQPCRYVVEGNTIHVYRKKPFLGIKMLDGIQRVDTGIALSHILMQAREEGMHGKFLKMKRSAAKEIYEISAIFE